MEIVSTQYRHAKHTSASAKHTTTYDKDPQVVRVRGTCSQTQRHSRVEVEAHGARAGNLRKADGNAEEGVAAEGTRGAGDEHGGDKEGGEEEGA